MTELHFDQLRIAHPSAPAAGITGSANGKRVALSGDWSALFAWLSGRAELLDGKARLGTVDMRALVVAGQLGVLDPALPLLNGQSAEAWIETYLRLRGLSKPEAQRGAKASLEQLGVGYLGRYKSEDLPASALYAVRAALALSTSPKAVLFSAPSWLAETQAFEQELLQRVEAASNLVLCCDPQLHPELFLGSESALILGREGLSQAVPRSYWNGIRRRFVVSALSHQAELVAKLESRGAQVLAPSPHGEFWVTLPEGTGPEMLLESAVECGAGLARFTPLFDSTALG